MVIDERHAGHGPKSNDRREVFDAWNRIEQSILQLRKAADKVFVFSVNEVLGIADRVLDQVRGRSFTFLIVEAILVPAKCATDLYDLVTCCWGKGRGDQRRFALSGFRVFD